MTYTIQISAAVIAMTALISVGVRIDHDYRIKPRKSQTLTVYSFDVIAADYTLFAAEILPVVITITKPSVQLRRT